MGFMSQKLSKTEAAYLILLKAGKPMHLKAITDAALSKGLIITSGKTPASTLATDLLLENRRRSERGIKKRFKKVGPAIWEAIRS